jgi:hypothetical protein
MGNPKLFYQVHSGAHGHNRCPSVDVRIQHIGSPYVRDGKAGHSSLAAPVFTLGTAAYQ